MLRISLSKQLVADYLDTIGRGKKLDGLDRQIASGAGATLADPLVAELVTPEALIALLHGGRPLPAGSESGPAGTGFSLDLSSVRQAFAMFVRSESRGFRNIYIPVPPDESDNHGLRLHMRLNGTTWRLAGIELPKRLRQELIKRMPRAQS
jgi:hypothetical protein